MYLLHGTFQNNILKILTSGKLDVKHNIASTTTIQSNHTKQIFTQLIFRDIVYESDQDPFWWHGCFVLSTDLLKDYPFYATDTGSYRKSFNEALKEKGPLKAPYMLARNREGKRTRMPSLTLLKRFINDGKNRRPWLGTTCFRHSHEILFGKAIPLSKYCSILVLYRSHPSIKKIESLCNKMNIKIIYFDNKIPDLNGLNRFLSLLDDA